MKKQAARMILGLAASLNLLILTGCEVDSSETGSRNVDINVWGVYHGQEDHYTTLVNNCSGSRPEYFDLRQYGDQLEAIDNHGIVFRGTIGSVNSDAKTCSFTLEGKTTVGNRVIVNGNINISGSIAIMEGTWIEDSLYAVLYGKATAPAQPTNITELTISPTSTSVTTGKTVQLTASGGTTPYTWTPSNPNYGDLSQTIGSTVIYTPKVFSNVTQVITVKDAANASKTCSITQQ